MVALLHIVTKANSVAVEPPTNLVAQHDETDDIYSSSTDSSTLEHTDYKRGGSGGTGGGGGGIRWGSGGRRSGSEMTAKTSSTLFVAAVLSAIIMNIFI